MHPTGDKLPNKFKVWQKETGKVPLSIRLMFFFYKDSSLMAVIQIT